MSKKIDYDNIVKHTGSATKKLRRQGKARTFWVRDTDYEEFRNNCGELGLTMGEVVVDLIRAFNKSLKP